MPVSNKSFERDASTASLSCSFLKLRLYAARSARLDSSVRCLCVYKQDSSTHPLTLLPLTILKNWGGFRRIRKRAGVNSLLFCLSYLTCNASLIFCISSSSCLTLLRTSSSACVIRICVCRSNLSSIVAAKTFNCSSKYCLVSSMCV